MPEPLVQSSDSNWQNSHKLSETPNESQEILGKGVTIENDRGG